MPFVWLQQLDLVHPPKGEYVNGSRCVEVLTYLLLIFIQALNNNSFLTNLIVQSAVSLYPMYQVIQQCGYKEGVDDLVVGGRFINFIELLCFIHFGQYLR
jgi:hypothetical protein